MWCNRGKCVDPTKPSGWWINSIALPILVTIGGGVLLIFLNDPIKNWWAGLSVKRNKARIQEVESQISRMESYRNNQGDLIVYGFIILLQFIGAFCFASLFATFNLLHAITSGTIVIEGGNFNALVESFYSAFTVILYGLALLVFFRGLNIFRSLLNFPKYKLRREALITSLRSKTADIKT